MICFEVKSHFNMDTNIRSKKSKNSQEEREMKHTLAFHAEGKNLDRFFHYSGRCLYYLTPLQFNWPYQSRTHKQISLPAKSPPVRRVADCWRPPRQIWGQRSRRSTGRWRSSSTRGWFPWKKSLGLTVRPRLGHPIPKSNVWRRKPNPGGFGTSSYHQSTTDFTVREGGSQTWSMPTWQSSPDTACSLQVWSLTQFNSTSLWGCLWFG